MKRLTGLQLAALIAISSPATAPAQVDVAQGHIQKGLAHASAGDTMLALAELEKAIDVAPDLADAHYQLGRIYTHRANAVETDFEDRMKAERALKRALRLNPDDPRYLLELGRLRLKQHMKVDAERLLKRSLDKAREHDDPEVLADIHFSLGYINEVRYLGMRNRRFRPFNRGPPVTDLRDMINSKRSSYVRGYLADAPRIEDHGSHERELMVEHYRAALLSDPGHVGAATRLMGHLLDDYRLAEYLAVARRLRDENVNRPEPYLYLGLGLHAAGREEDAEQAFERGLAGLPDEERQAIESLEPVLRRDDAERYTELDEVDRDEFESRYWQLTDPLFLTDANERRLEHLARVAYADLRYAAPSADARGWETDRGIIFIRYGPPDEVATMGAETTNHGDPYAVGRRSIVWSYGKDGPSFIFRQTPGYLNARFAGDYKFIAEDYRYKQPSIYDEIPSIPELLSVPVQIARFRDEDPDKLAVEVHAALPLEGLARDLDLHQSEVQTGMFIVNEHAERIVEEEQTMVLAYDDAEDVDELRSWRVSTPEGGQLIVAVEARDAISWRSAAGRDTFTARVFPADSLVLSDILIADYVYPLVEEPVHRFDYEIVPNPGLQFQSGEPVNIYYELYGLERDDEGFASFDVALSVRVKELYRTGTITKIVGTLADTWGFSIVGDDRLELRYSREAKLEDRDRVTEYVQLDLEGAPPGAYEIRLRVWDRLGERLTSRTRTIEVLDRPADVDEE